MTPRVVRIGEISNGPYSKLLSPILFQLTIRLFHDD